jgi:hypothetical protein
MPIKGTACNTFNNYFTPCTSIFYDSMHWKWLFDALCRLQDCFTLHTVQTLVHGLSISENKIMQFLPE